MEAGEDRPPAASEEDDRGMGLYSLEVEPITCLACGGHLRIIPGRGVLHMDSTIDADHEAVLPRGRDDGSAD
jgi:hypothetical protein